MDLVAGAMDREPAEETRQEAETIISPYSLYFLSSPSRSIAGNAERVARDMQTNS